MVTPAAGMGRMNEWPEGWFRDGGAGRPPGTPGAAGPGEPTANVPASGYGHGGGQRPGSYGAPASGRPGSGSAWPEQPEPAGIWDDEPRRYDPRRYAKSSRSSFVGNGGQKRGFLSRLLGK